MSSEEEQVMEVDQEDDAGDMNLTEDIDFSGL